MTTVRWFVLAIGSAALLVNAPVSAKAADWMPLTVGTYWVYTAGVGVHQVETITGQRTLRGRTVAVKTYSEGVDVGLENYWLLDADGSVLLAGFTQPDGFALAYEPPVRILPVPPVFGDQPWVLTTAYEIPSDAVYATFEIRYDVVEDVELSLPAGSFHAFGTGQVVRLPGQSDAVGRAFMLDGRTPPKPGASLISVQATDWYSEGVGVVQYQSNALYQLSYSNLPTAAKLTSWARVKQLYR